VQVIHFIIYFTLFSFLLFRFYERSINVHTYLYIKSYLHLCYN
ncbi:hypothetical protein PFNF54_01685, partial [Plasmodium falciparum NF54]